MISVAASESFIFFCKLFAKVSYIGFKVLIRSILSIRLLLYRL